MAYSLVLDSSALIAVFLKETGWDTIREQIANAEMVAIGAATLLEAHMVLTSKTGKDALPLLEAFIRETNAQVLPFAESHWRLAAQAFLRFGKGRSKAALNFGGCIAYATAKSANLPLLFQGDDFERTDVLAARD
jgi:ribonuclease VapC